MLWCGVPVSITVRNSPKRLRHAIEVSFDPEAETYFVITGQTEKETFIAWLPCDQSPFDALQEFRGVRERGLNFGYEVIVGGTPVFRCVISEVFQEFDVHKESALSDLPFFNCVGLQQWLSLAFEPPSQLVPPRECDSFPQ